MTLLEQNKEALRAMAMAFPDQIADQIPDQLADQPLAEQKRLQRLIQSDPECRAYWEEMTSLTGDLHLHASPTEPDLPPGFHDRLMNRLTRPAPAQPTVQRFRTPSLAQSILGASALLLFALFLKHERSPNLPIQSPTESSMETKHSPTTSDQYSWAALRSTNADPVNLIVVRSNHSAPQEHPKMSWAEREHWIQEFDL